MFLLFFMMVFVPNCQDWVSSGKIQSVCVVCDDGELKEDHWGDAKDLQSFQFALSNPSQRLPVKYNVNCVYTVIYANGKTEYFEGTQSSLYIQNKVAHLPQIELKPATAVVLDDNDLIARLQKLPARLP